MSNPKLNRVSIGLNVLLAATCLFLAARRNDSNSSTPPAPMDSPSSAVGVAKPDAGTTPDLNATKQKAPRSWTAILRDQGVPERVLAQVVLADFADRWQARQAEAQQAYNRGELDSDGLAALDQKREIEQEADFRSALGEGAFREWDQERLFQQFNLNGLDLSANETNSLYDLAAGLRQRLRDLTAARLSNGIDQATLNDEQARAQSEFGEKVHALLGDARHRILHGTDPAVGDLRRALRGITMDTNQFSALLQAQQKWDSQRSELEQQELNSGDAAISQQLDRASENRDEVFTSILGTNGFSQFQRQQDSRYLEMQKNAARWGLDGTAVDYVYDTIRAYEDAVRVGEKVAGTPGASDPDALKKAIENSLQSLGQQARDNVRAAVGEPAYAAIVRNQILPFDTPPVSQTAATP